MGRAGTRERDEITDEDDGDVRGEDEREDDDEDSGAWKTVDESNNSEENDYARQRLATHPWVTHDILSHSRRRQQYTRHPDLYTY